MEEFKTGDLVFGMLNFSAPGNAYTEYAIGKIAHLSKIPEGTSFDEAAGATLAALTALQSLRNHVKAGDKVLIHAGAGGVGHYAIQIAKPSPDISDEAISLAKEKNIDLSFYLVEANGQI